MTRLTKLVLVLSMSIMVFGVQADDCTIKHGKITNAGNRGAHFDVNGGMRHKGLTYRYPQPHQTVFKGKGDRTIKPGYMVDIVGSRMENTMCSPTKVTIYTK